MAEDGPATPGILRKHAGGAAGGTMRRLHFNESKATRSPKIQPPARASASQRLEAIASQMQQRHEQMYQEQQQQLQQNQDDGVGPTRLWPPSRKREEATALRNLKRVLANRQLRTVGDDEDAKEPKDPEKEADRVLAEQMANMALDNRKQLIAKVMRPVALVSEGHEAATDWHDSEFISECLCWHNVYRQRHGVRDLAMSAELCDMAQHWANHLAHANAFMYKPGETSVGQNLYCRLPNTVATEVTGQEVAAYWYSAGKKYHYGKEPDVLHANVNAGHFTQLVWAATRELGVGKARSRQGKTVVVAMYHPPGNISGAFQENVPFPGNVTSDLEMSLSDSSSSYSA
ncbi:uncharacterized protein LOC117649315 isoform X2 [Thrips palmi]|uniref:Uncharacterized protein LOC117649315 isoform X2 n=1 Tax=Thrips palmi TaxID=161013 RepID=A0A6P8ZRP2_THRPL|nr:uncharacterized protein LOC117649315 isoform X2 [Thrips palmi]